ncbi:MAG: hypothetical protein RI902_2462 [Pseudomonadota bacterium]|jgi:hypothetical protein
MKTSIAISSVESFEMVGNPNWKATPPDAVLVSDACKKPQAFLPGVLASAT